LTSDYSDTLLAPEQSRSISNRPTMLQLQSFLSSTPENQLLAHRFKPALSWRFDGSGKLHF